MKLRSVLFAVEFEHIIKCPRFLLFQLPIDLHDVNDECPLRCKTDLRSSPCKLLTDDFHVTLLDVEALQDLQLGLLVPLNLLRAHWFIMSGSE